VAAAVPSPILDAKKKKPIQIQDLLQAYREKVKELDDEEGDSVRVASF